MQLRTYSSSRLEIATFQKGTPAQEFLPLITDAHNLRYSHAEKNCLYFQIFRFPYKEMTKAVLYLNSFQEWAHPLTLESVTAELTEEQKLIAAKMLKAYFAA